MLEMDDEELLKELERYFQSSDERGQRISDELGDLMQEVDRLISRMDEIEDEPLNESLDDEEPEPCQR